MQDLQYYQKYYKYKQKYLNLIQQRGGDPFDDINNNLYLKFITERLVDFLPKEISDIALELSRTSIIKGSKKRRNIEAEELLRDVPAMKASKYSPRIRKKPIGLADYVEHLTPAILDYLSPGARSRMEGDFEIDNVVIERLNEIQEEKDDDYKNYENRGKLIEAWVANNMRCPCCKAQHSLRRYLSDFMPIIDLVCINMEHTINDGVRFFQVKTSNGIPFMDKPYFNYDASESHEYSNTIHVGSRTWGEPVHNIIPFDSQFNKKILCGYICIQYRENEDVLRIHIKNSMIVLPEYLLSDRLARRKLPFGGLGLEESSAAFNPELPVIIPDPEKTWYYRYVEPTAVKHNRIKFNLKTNKIISNEEMDALFTTLDIDKSYKINTDIMLNPLSIIE